MKKIIFFLVFTLLTAVVFAQNFEDNEFYRKSVELKELAKTELEKGNYEKSIQYSQESEEQSRLSLEYIEKMKLLYRANSKVKMAGYRIDYAKRIRLARFNQSLFDSATAWYNAAVEAFESEDYPTAIVEADKVINALKDIRRLYEASADGYVQYYIVKLVPHRRDCLWRIAKKKEVYGDASKWTILYEANKETLKSDSPHLIYPGEKLYIPSIEGEKRSGSL